MSRAKARQIRRKSVERSASSSSRIIIVQRLQPVVSLFADATADGSRGAQGDYRHETRSRGFIAGEGTDLASGFGLIALTVATAGALGPTVAALILSVATWPWLLLVNLPVCLVAAPLFIAVAPRSRRTPRSFDLPGALLNTAALGLLVVDVNIRGGHARQPIVALAAGLVFLAFLVWHQTRRPMPLLPLDLLRIPIIAWSAATPVCSYAAQSIGLYEQAIAFRFTRTASRMRQTRGRVTPSSPVRLIC